MASASAANIFWCKAVRAWETVEYCDVSIGTETLFHVTNSEFKSASDRADEINERIKRIVSEPGADPSTFLIHTGLDGNPTIMLDTHLVCTVRPLDAQTSGMTQQALADVWLKRLQQGFEQYKREQSKAPAEPQPGKKKTGLGQHAVLLLFFEIGVLLFASLLFGELFVRLGQPAIIGQIMSGIVLGQTIFGTWESLSIGLGANARGSTGLILAMLGYTLNIISLDMLAVFIIFVAVASTALTPPLMKWALGKVQVTEEERQRAEKEELRAGTILSSIRRVLRPTAGKGRNRFIGKLQDSIGERQVIETTALWVKQPESANGEPFQSIAQAINKQHVTLSKRTVRSDNTVEAIVNESNRGYDLLVMASDAPATNATHVFGQIVDTVILKTSARVLVVYEPEQSGQVPIRKVLVPASANDVSFSAAEFGITLAKSLDAHITWLLVSEADSKALYSEKTRSGEKLEGTINDEISSRLSDLSQAFDVNFESALVQTSAHPAEAIILEAQRRNIDLIVLGAERKLSRGLFLGHTINFILRHAPCTVAVLKLRG